MALTRYKRRNASPQLSNGHQPLYMAQLMCLFVLRRRNFTKELKQFTGNTKKKGFFKLFRKEPENTEEPRGTEEERVEGEVENGVS